jgi:hypothetical protein
MHSRHRLRRNDWTARPLPLTYRATRLQVDLKVPTGAEHPCEAVGNERGGQDLSHCDLLNAPTAAVSRRIPLRAAIDLRDSGYGLPEPAACSPPWLLG